MHTLNTGVSASTLQLVGCLSRLVLLLLLGHLVIAIYTLVSRSPHDSTTSSPARPHVVITSSCTFERVGIRRTCSGTSPRAMPRKRRLQHKEGLGLTLTVYQSNTITDKTYHSTEPASNKSLPNYPVVRTLTTRMNRATATNQRTSSSPTTRRRAASSCSETSSCSQPNNKAKRQTIVQLACVVVGGDLGGLGPCRQL